MHSGLLLCGLPVAHGAENGSERLWLLSRGLDHRILGVGH
jgi:hypothetical protein